MKGHSGEYSWVHSSEFITSEVQATWAIVKYPQLHDLVGRRAEISFFGSLGLGIRPRLKRPGFRSISEPLFSSHSPLLSYGPGLLLLPISRGTSQLVRQATADFQMKYGQNVTIRMILRDKHQLSSHKISEFHTSTAGGV